MINENSSQATTALVTGGAGFIGLNLIEALLEAGSIVVSYSQGSIPDAFHERIHGLSGRLIAVDGDVRDGEKLSAVLKEHRVETMFPLAAVTADARREASEPERLFSVNVGGMITQLRAARESSVACVVVPASGAIYGDSYVDRDVVDETSTTCEPRDLYGITKYAVERTALRLGQLWALRVVVARIGGTFGPWERPTGVRDLITPFYHLARMAYRGEEAVLPADFPDYCWVYSRDIARGLIHLSQMPGGFVANVSSGVHWGDSLLEFAAELQRIFPSFRWRQSLCSNEVNLTLTDTRSRARMNISRMVATGWQPNFSPRVAISDYTNWLTKNGAAVFE
jgi:nucleoside-diphosphate-sugar epimerase